MPLQLLQIPPPSPASPLHLVVIVVVSLAMPAALIIIIQQTPAPQTQMQQLSIRPERISCMDAAQHPPVARILDHPAAIVHPTAAPHQIPHLIRMPPVPYPVVMMQSQPPPVLRQPDYRAACSLQLPLP